jgi:hypothetical protein
MVIIDAVLQGLVEKRCYSTSCAQNYNCRQFKRMFINIVAVGKQKEARRALQTGSELIDIMQIAGA